MNHCGHQDECDVLSHGEQWLWTTVLAVRLGGAAASSRLRHSGHGSRARPGHRSAVPHGPAGSGHCPRDCSPWRSGRAGHREPHSQPHARPPARCCQMGLPLLLLLRSYTIPGKLIHCPAVFTYFFRVTTHRFVINAPRQNRHFEACIFVYQLEI